MQSIKTILLVRSPSKEPRGRLGGRHRPAPAGPRAAHVGNPRLDAAHRFPEQVLRLRGDRPLQERRQRPAGGQAGFISHNFGGI